MLDDERGIDQIVQRGTNKLMAAYDDHLIKFLEKNGIKVDRRNMVGTMRELENRGYKVLTERVSTPMESTTWTFYLTKIVDKTELKMTYSLKIDNEKE